MNNEVSRDRDYINTEQRLYRYKALCSAVTDHKRQINELKDLNPDALYRSSKSIVSLKRNNSRYDPLDAFEKQIGLLRVYVKADEYEIRKIRAALRKVRNDPYYMSIEYKYFSRKTDEEASRALKCSVSTLRRNRTRLLKEITNELYCRRI